MPDPTAEPPDTAEAPSWNVALNKSRGLGDTQGAPGGGDNRPHTPNPTGWRGAAGKERGCRRISGFSGEISAGNHFV